MFNLNRKQSFPIKDHSTIHWGFNVEENCTDFYIFDSNEIQKYQLNSDSTLWQKKWTAPLQTTDLTTYNRVIYFPKWLDRENIVITKTTTGINFYKLENSSFNLIKKSEDFVEDVFHDALRWDDANNLIKTGHFYKNRTIIGMFTRHDSLGVRFYGIDKDQLYLDSYPILSLDVNLNKTEDYSISDFYFADIQCKGQENLIIRNRHGLNIYEFNINNDLEHLMEIPNGAKSEDTKQELYFPRVALGQSYRDIVVFNSSGMFDYKYNNGSKNYEFHYYDGSYSEIRGWTWKHQSSVIFEDIDLDGQDEMLLRGPRGIDLKAFERSTNQWKSILNDSDFTVSERHSKIVTVKPISIEKINHPILLTSNKNVLHLGDLIETMEDEEQFLETIQTELMPKSNSSRQLTQQYQIPSLLQGHFITEKPIHLVRDQIDISSMMNAIDTYTGRVNFHVPLVQLYNELGDEMKVNIIYSGIDCRPGIMGLGWSLPQNFITVDHQSTIYSDLHHYYMVVEDAPTLLTFDTENSSDTIYSFKLPNDQLSRVKIIYYKNEEKWIIKNANVTQIYGGIHTSQVPPITWGIGWENWRGVGGSSTGQKKIAISWYLSKVQKGNIDINFTYEIVEASTITTKNTFTREIYLKSIKYLENHVIFAYSKKTDDEYDIPEIVNSDGFINSQMIQSQYLMGCTLLTPTYIQNIDFVYTIENGVRFLSEIWQQKDPTNKPILHFNYIKISESYMVESATLPTGVRIQFYYKTIGEVSHIDEQLGHITLDVPQNHQVHSIGYDIIISYINEEGQVVLKQCRQEMINDRVISPIYPQLGHGAAKNFQIIPQENYLAVIIHYSVVKELHLLQKLENTWKKTAEFDFKLETMIKFGKSFVLTAEKKSVIKIITWDTDSKSWKTMSPINPAIESRSPVSVVVYNDMFLAYDNDIFWIGYKNHKQMWHIKQILKFPKGMDSITKTLNLFQPRDVTHDKLTTYFTANSLQMHENFFILSRWFEKDWKFYTKIDLFVLNNKYELADQKQYNIPRYDLFELKVESNANNGVSFVLGYGRNSTLSSSPRKMIPVVSNLSGPKLEEAYNKLQSDYPQAPTIEVQKKVKEVVSNEILKNVDILFDPSWYICNLNLQSIICGNDTLTFMGNDWKLEKKKMEKIEDKVSIKLGEKYILSKESDSFIKLYKTFKGITLSYSSLANLGVKNFHNIFNAYPAYLVSHNEFSSMKLLRFSKTGQFLVSVLLPQHENLTTWSNYQTLITSIGNYDEKNTTTLVFRQMTGLVQLVPNPVVFQSSLILEENCIRNTGYEYKSPTVIGNQVYYKELSVIPGNNRKSFGWIREMKNLSDSSKNSREIYNAENKVIKTEYSEQKSNDQSIPTEQPYLLSNSTILDRSNRFKVAKFSNSFVADDEVGYYGFEDYEFNVDDQLSSSKKWIFNETDIKKNQFSFTGKNYLQLSQTILHASFQPKYQYQSYIASCWIRSSSEALNENYYTPYFKAIIEDDGGRELYSQLGEVKYKSDDWYYLEVIVDFLQARGLQMALSNSTLIDSLKNKLKTRILVAPRTNLTIDLDHIRFSPMDSNFEAMVYDMKTQRLSEKIFANGLVRRFVDDNFQNEIAIIDDYGYVREISVSTKASSTDRILSLYSIVKIRPQMGYFESFSPFSFHERWTIQDSLSWQISPNKIFHLVIKEDELRMNMPKIDQKSFGLRLDYTLSSSNSYISCGNCVSLQQSAKHEIHMTIRTFVANIPSNGEILVMIENLRLLVWIDGGLYFDGPSDNCICESLKIAGKVAISDVFVFSKSSVDVTYYNSLKEKLQKIVLEDDHTALVTEYLYDEIGRQDITTQTACIHRSPVQSLLSHYPSFVINKDIYSTNSIWKTGKLQGESTISVGEYGYTQIKYSANPLNEAIAVGLPDKEFSVSSSLARRYSSSDNNLFINNFYPITSNFTHQVEYKPGSIKYIRILDSNKNIIAKYISTPKTEDILTTFEYNSKGELIKVFSPLYHEKVETLKQIVGMQKTISTETRVLYEKLITNLEYNENSQIITKKTPDSEKVQHIYDEDLLKFTLYFSSDNKIQYVTYYDYDNFDRLVETGMLTMFNPDTPDEIKDMQLTSNNTQIYQQFHYNDLEHEPITRKKIKRTITYNNDEPFIEETTLDANDKVISKAVVLSIEDNRFQMMEIYKEYVAGRIAVIQYPANVRGQAFKLTHQYNKLGQLIGIGTPGNEFSIMKFYYNAAGQLSSEQYVPESNKTFNRKYKYSAAGFLLELQDMFLEEKVMYTTNSYGGQVYNDGTVSSTEFQAKWHKYIADEGLGVHEHSFSGSKFTKEESKLCFDRLHDAGYLDINNHQTKVFYPALNIDFPIIFSYGVGSRQIQSILGKSGFPTQYGHKYDYGPYQELTKAKYFVGDEAPMPLQPGTFAKEILGINNTASMDIWKILNHLGYITIDSTKLDLSFAHGKQTQKAYVRSSLFEDLLSIDKTFGKYTQPLQKVLLSAFSQKMTTSSIKTLVQNIFKNWIVNNDESKMKKNADSIVDMLEKNDYLQNPLSNEFKTSLKMYQVYLPDIVKVLQVHFATQLGKGEFDIESYKIDVNGNHRMFYTGFDRYELFYHHDSNQIDYITFHAFSSIELSKNYTIEHDTRGNIIKAQHKGIDNIFYHPVSNRPIYMNLSDGRSIIFFYDAQGERILKRIKNSQGRTTNEIYYSRDEFGRVLVERKVTYISSNLPPDEQLTLYIYGPRGLVGFIREDGFYNVISDHEGSTRVIVRDGEVVGVFDYLPYGGIMRKHIVYPDAQISYLYTGQELDEETGLYNFHARFYDPTIGRFYQMDPKEQYSSPYKYGSNSPISVFDPDGEFAFFIPLIFGLVGAYLGGAAANEKWNPLKWDYTSSKTWTGIIGGGIGGALLPVGFGASVAALQAVGFSSVGAIVSTTALGVTGTYLHAAATNGEWNFKKWDWENPATYNSMFQGFGAGAGAIGGIANTRTFYLELSSKLGKVAFVGTSVLSAAGIFTLNGYATNWNFSNPALYVGAIDAVLNAGDLPMIATSGAKFFARRAGGMVKDFKTLKSGMEGLLKGKKVSNSDMKKTIHWLENVMDSHPLPLFKHMVKTLDIPRKIWNTPFVANSAKLLASGAIIASATLSGIEDQQNGWDATKYYALINGLTAGGQIAFSQRTKYRLNGKAKSKSSNKLQLDEQLCSLSSRVKRSTSNKCVLAKIEKKNNGKKDESQTGGSNGLSQIQQKSLNDGPNTNRIKQNLESEDQWALIHKAIVEEHAEVEWRNQQHMKMTVDYYMKAFDQIENFKEKARRYFRHEVKVDDDLKIPNRVITVASTDQGIDAVAVSGSHIMPGVVVYYDRNVGEYTKIALKNNKFIARQKVELSADYINAVKKKRDDIRNTLVKKLEELEKDLKNNVMKCLSFYEKDLNFPKNVFDKFYKKLNEFIKAEKIQHLDMKGLQWLMKETVKYEIAGLPIEKKDKIQLCSKSIKELNKLFSKVGSMFGKLKSFIDKVKEIRLPSLWDEHNCGEPHVIFALENIKYYLPKQNSIKIGQVTHMGSYALPKITKKEFHEKGSAFTDELEPKERCNYCKVTTASVEKFITDKEWLEKIESMKKRIEDSQGMLSKTGNSEVDSVQNKFTDLKIADETKQIRRKRSVLSHLYNNIAVDNNVYGINNGTLAQSSSSSNSTSWSTWINDTFNLMTDSIENLFASYNKLPTSNSFHSSASSITEPFDTNGTILLFDLFLRKVGGKRFSTTMKEDESTLLDIQAVTLNIIEEFERIIFQVAKKSGYPKDSINFDPIKAQAIVIKLLRNGDTSKISLTLFQYAKEIYYLSKQNDIFVNNLKHYLEKNFKFNPKVVNETLV